MELRGIAAEDQKTIGGRGMTGSRSWSPANVGESRTPPRFPELAKVSDRPNRLGNVAANHLIVVDLSQISFRTSDRGEKHADYTDLSGVFIWQPICSIWKAGTEVHHCNRCPCMNVERSDDRGQPHSYCGRL